MAVHSDWLPTTDACSQRMSVDVCEWLLTVDGYAQ